MRSRVRVLDGIGNAECLRRLRPDALGGEASGKLIVIFRSLRHRRDELCPNFFSIFVSRRSVYF